LCGKSWSLSLTTEVAAEEKDQDVDAAYEGTGETTRDWSVKSVLRDLTLVPAGFDTGVKAPRVGTLASKRREAFMCPCLLQQKHAPAAARAMQSPRTRVGSAGSNCTGALPRQGPFVELA
jgi:hypothetical protein